jgi:hypothetical protein
VLLREIAAALKRRQAGEAAMTKITPKHLARSACVYIRQSTADQLAHDHESRRCQSELSKGPVVLMFKLRHEADVSPFPGGQRPSPHRHDLPRPQHAGRRQMVLGPQRGTERFLVRSTASCPRSQGGFLRGLAWLARATGLITSGGPANVIRKTRIQNRSDLYFRVCWSLCVRSPRPGRIPQLVL